MAAKLICAKCGAPLDKPSGAGRPRRFCSSGCKRAAEHEVRRLNRRLEHLEEIMSHARIAPEGDVYGESPAERDARPERVRAEIDLTERRLRSLFATEEKT